MAMSVRTSRRGTFRFVDLVAVVVMLGILTATALPAIQVSHEADNRKKCAKNLHDLGIAIDNFDAQVNRLPQPAGTNFATGTSVLDQLLPFFEAEVKPVNGDVDVLRCPSDAGFVSGSGGTSYGVNIRGWNAYGKSGGSFTTLAQIPGGTSNTIAAGDLSQAGTYLRSAPNTRATTTTEGEYNGYYGAKLKATTRTGPGSNATAVDGSGLRAPLFSSYHSSGRVNVSCFDGHVVQANIQGSYDIDNLVGSGISGACHPAVGNPTGEWATEIADDADGSDREATSDRASGREVGGTAWWKIALWVGGGFTAGVMLATIMFLIIMLVRRKPSARAEAFEDDERPSRQFRRP